MLEHCKVYCMNKYVYMCTYDLESKTGTALRGLFLEDVHSWHKQLVASCLMCGTSLPVSLLACLFMTQPGLETRPARRGFLLAPSLLSWGPCLRLLKTLQNPSEGKKKTIGVGRGIVMEWPASQGVNKVDIYMRKKNIYKKKKIYVGKEKKSLDRVLQLVHIQGPTQDSLLPKWPLLYRQPLPLGIPFQLRKKEHTTWLIIDITHSPLNGKHFRCYFSTSDKAHSHCQNRLISPSTTSNIIDRIE